MDEKIRARYLGDIEYFSEKLEKDKGSMLFLPLASAYINLSQYDEAVNVLLSGLDANPDMGMAKTMLAQAYMGLGRTEEAKGLLTEMRVLDTSNYLAEKLLGNIYRSESELKKAVICYKNAYSIAPEDTQLKNLIEELISEAGLEGEDLYDDRPIGEEDEELLETLGQELADEVRQEIGETDEKVSQVTEDEVKQTVDEIIGTEEEPSLEGFVDEEISDELVDELEEEMLASLDDDIVPTESIVEIPQENMQEEAEEDLPAEDISDMAAELSADLGLDVPESETDVSEETASEEVISVDVPAEEPVSEDAPSEEAEPEEMPIEDSVPEDMPEIISESVPEDIVEDIVVEMPEEISGVDIELPEESTDMPELAEAETGEIPEIPEIPEILEMSEISEISGTDTDSEPDTVEEIDIPEEIKADDTAEPEPEEPEPEEPEIELPEEEALLAEELPEDDAVTAGEIVIPDIHEQPLVLDVAAYEPDVDDLKQDAEELKEELAQMPDAEEEAVAEAVSEPDEPYMMSEEDEKIISDTKEELTKEDKLNEELAILFAMEELEEKAKEGKIYECVSTEADDSLSDVKSRYPEGLDNATYEQVNRLENLLEIIKNNSK